MTERKTRRHWRYYRTSSRVSPLDAFLDVLTDEDYAAVDAAMERVAKQGLEASRHLRGDVYEVRVWGENRGYRVLFATEGRFGQGSSACTASPKKRSARRPGKSS